MSSDLVSVDDIVRRVGPISDESRDNVEEMILDAILSVEDYLDMDIPAADATDSWDQRTRSAAARVVSRMVVRGIEQQQSRLNSSVASGSSATGPYNHQFQVAAAAQGGGVWMNPQDRKMLRRYKNITPMFSVEYSDVPNQNRILAREQSRGIGGEFW